MHLPYSTGFGIGYSINSFLDVHFEPKLHSWELYYEGGGQNSQTNIAEFRTFTLGVGVEIHNFNGYRLQQIKTLKMNF
ncbi:MAG: hypothetical protein WKF89_06300 [Chitinophagaceae bacterium]